MSEVEITDEMVEMAAREICCRPSPAYGRCSFGCYSARVHYETARALCRRLALCGYAFTGATAP